MRIVTISDSPNLFSGMARVHRNIIDSLVAAQHEVIFCGWWAYDAQTMAKIQKGEPPPSLIYKSAGRDVRGFCVPKGQRQNALTVAYDVINACKPDILITLGDIWDAFYVQAIKIKTDFSFKWCPYINIEHEDLKSWAPLLGYADAIMVPSKFGAKVVKDEVGMDAIVIPYGTGDVFTRLPDERRAELRKSRGCEGKVRMIAVSQNTVRKNLPALFQAIALMKEDAQFYIHTNMGAMDPQEAFIFDIKGIIARLGIESKVSFPSGQVSSYSSPPDEILRDEYNASDFFVSSSIVEGYGLPHCEAMACGLPVIAPETSTIPEHLGNGTGFGAWKERGRAVRGNVVITPPAKFLSMVDPVDLAAALDEATHMARAELSGQKQGLLADMRAACQEYGKERTWSATKEAVCGVVREAAGVATIPVEIL